MPTVRVTSEHDIGNARRRVMDFCRTLPFTEVELGEIAIIVTEMSSNLAKHATVGGTIIFDSLPELAGVMLTSADDGPGLSDIAFLDDGKSSAHSMGGGLGAIRRLADRFSLLAGDGTVLTVEKVARAARKNTLKAGIYVRPHPGYSVSGDGFICLLDRSKPLVAVIDGLGHGAEANRAKEAACASIENTVGRELADILQHMHGALRGSRGAAAFVSEFDREARIVRYFSIGNIDARILTEAGTTYFPNQAGVIGYRIATPQIRQEHWGPGMMLVVTSDGVSRNWSKEDYPNWQEIEAGLFCYSLVHEFGRLTDDAIAMVVRDEG